MAKAIGEAVRVRPGVLRVRVRAEGKGIVGDLDQEMDDAEFSAAGWPTASPIESLAVGDSAPVLSVD